MSIQVGHSRREFLTSTQSAMTLAVTSAALLGGCLPGRRGERAPEGNLKGSVNIDGTPVRYRVRRSVWSSAGAYDLQQYAKAVAILRARDPASFTSWEYQASIHNQFCPHNNWFFLPWHRGYLYFFEKLCADALNDPEFALPYWDWTYDRRVPPLLFSDLALKNRRQIGTLDKLSEADVGADVISWIMNINDFYVFASGPSAEQRGWANSGMLEATPHNAVHNFVGGDMATFFSPRDPVFWLHHANIDRLWSEWQRRNPAAAYPYPVAGFTPEMWLNFNFDNNFVLPNGTGVSLTVTQTQMTTTFGYIYDGQIEAIAAETREMLRVRADLAVANANPSWQFAVSRDRYKLEFKSNIITASVPLDVAVGGVTLRQVIEAFKARPLASAVLEVKNLKVPEDPGMMEQLTLQFFANELNLSEATRAVDNIHYIGSYSFFEHGGTHHHGEAFRALSLDMSQAIRMLIERGRDLRTLDKIDLQMLAKRQDGGPISWSMASVFGEITLQLMIKGA